MSFDDPRFRLYAHDFAPGFLTTPESDTLPDGATPDAKNCVLGSVEVQDQRRATIERRNGSRLLNPVAIATGQPVDIFDFIRETTSETLLAVCNGALYTFNNIDTFVAVSGGTGFSTTAPARMMAFRSNAFVYDGTQQKRYNGTQAFGVGFVAPTGPPTLAAGAGTLTGTYEGYAIWYDSVMDHESSPPLNADGSLALSAQVALAAQGRTWGKPAGAPPSNVDKWRVYCRRVDTNERNYFRCAEVAIGTASVTETISDLGRTNIGPAPHENDVPPAFAVQTEYKGFRLGAKATSSDLYISKQYDAESQHPSNVFAIGGKGESKPIQSIRVYGEECLIQKPRKSYRLIGDILPFKFTPIDGSLGNVSQEAGIEVNGQFFAWDEAVGPYRTDLTSWTPLANARIEREVKSANRLHLGDIRCEHWSDGKLILWSIPTDSPRKRTLLPYNYILNRWLPPMTGLEYNSLAQFTTTDGRLGLYTGDYWGRVHELFFGDVDSVPSGSTSAAITSAATNRITCAAATFFVTGNGLAGIPAGVRSPAGDWQFVRIQSNTATVLTLDTTNGPALDPLPDGSGTWTVYIGAIEAYWKTPHRDNDRPGIRKLARWFLIDLRMSTPGHSLEVNTFIDDIETDVTTLIVTPSSGLVWGSGIWGVSTWSGGTDTMQKTRVGRSYRSIQFRFRNFYPNEPWAVLGYGLWADAIAHRTVPSA